MWKATVVTIFLLTLQDSFCGNFEKKLFDDLLGNYSVLVRPVENETDPLFVKLGIDIQQIIDINEKNQIMYTNLWLNLEWIDIYMTWNPADYNGIKKLHLPNSKIWRPDILLYNSADQKFDATWPTNYIVHSNGTINWIPPTIILSTCKIDITWFPFDDQLCQLKFGTWSYSGLYINLTYGSIKTSTYTPNGEWDLLGITAERNAEAYECCKEELYIDVTFNISLRRRTLYYGFNLIIPCVLISTMTLLGFTLPPDSGEKLTLGVATFMSLTVFLFVASDDLPRTSDAVSLCGLNGIVALVFYLQMVASVMPPTGETVPLLGIYFSAIMIIVSTSVVFTALILNFHHRKSETHTMPEWVRKVFLNWLPWFLLMKRPGVALERPPIFETDSSRYKKVDLACKHNPCPPSQHLLRNLDQAERHVQNPLMGQVNLAPHRGHTARIAPTDISQTEKYRPAPPEMEDITRIVQDVRYIASRFLDQELKDDVMHDWQFAAMAVDRLCLIIFSCLLIVGTCSILFSGRKLLG